MKRVYLHWFIHAVSRPLMDRKSFMLLMLISAPALQPGMALAQEPDIIPAQKQYKALEKDIQMMEQVKHHAYLSVSDIITQTSFQTFKSEDFFLNQIRPPGPALDIESFYKNYSAFIFNSIVTNTFHSALNDLRKEDFLRHYLRKKWIENSKENPIPVNEFFEYVENGDLNSLKNFIHAHSFSEFEKVLTVISLIHTKRLNGQILGFIENLTLDINQELKNESFMSENGFHFLKPGVTISSIAHELLSTGDPKITAQLMKNENIDWTFKNFLNENFIHFFIRSNAWANTVSSKARANTLNQMMNKLSFLLRERDINKETPLQLAIKTKHAPLVGHLWKAVQKLPTAEKKDILENKSFRAGNLIDILIHNGFADKNNQSKSFLEIVMKEMQDLSVETGESFYTVKDGKYRGKPINVIPYIRLSSFFRPHLELFRDPLKQFMYTEDSSRLTQFNKETSGYYVSSLEALIQKLDMLEFARQKALSHLLAVKPQTLSIMSAIQKKDEKAFLNLNPEEKKAGEMIIDFGREYEEIQSQRSSAKKAPSTDYQALKTHFLNEAIIHSSLPAVEYFLNNGFDRSFFKNLTLDTTHGEPQGLEDLVFTHVDVIQDKPGFLLIDPLSLALFSYAGLPQDSPDKKSARQIIRLLAEYQNPGAFTQSFIRSPPINWALALGQLEEVKFFHEEKGVEIPENLAINIGEEIVIMNSIFQTELNSFIKLRDYISIQLNEAGHKVKCRAIFAH